MGIVIQFLLSVVWKLMFLMMKTNNRVDQMDHKTLQWKMKANMEFR